MRFFRKLVRGAASPSEAIGAESASPAFKEAKAEDGPDDSSTTPSSFSSSPSVQNDAATTAAAAGASSPSVLSACTSMTVSSACLQSLDRGKVSPAALKETTMQSESVAPSATVGNESTKEEGGFGGASSCSSSSGAVDTRENETKKTALFAAAEARQLGFLPSETRKGEGGTVSDIAYGQGYQPLVSSDTDPILGGDPRWLHVLSPLTPATLRAFVRTPPPPFTSAVVPPPPAGVQHGGAEIYVTSAGRQNMLAKPAPPPPRDISPPKSKDELTRKLEEMFSQANLLRDRLLTSNIRPGEWTIDLDALIKHPLIESWSITMQELEEAIGKSRVLSVCNRVVEVGKGVRTDADVQLAGCPEELMNDAQTGGSRRTVNCVSLSGLLSDSRNTLVFRDMPEDTTEESLIAFVLQAPVMRDLVESGKRRGADEGIRKQQDGKTERDDRAEAIKRVKQEVNNTWFVTVGSEDIAQEAALWLRMQKFQDMPVRVGIKATHSLQQILSTLLSSEGEVTPSSQQRSAARCDSVAPWNSQLANSLDDPRLAPFNPAPVHPAMLPPLAGSPSPVQRLGSSDGLSPTGLYPSPYVYSNLPPPRISRSLLRAYRPFPPPCPPAFGTPYNAAAGSVVSRLSSERSICGFPGGGRATVGRVPAPPCDVGAAPYGALGTPYDVSWGPSCGPAVRPFWTSTVASCGIGGPYGTATPQGKTGAPTMDELPNGSYHTLSEPLVGTGAVDPAEESEQGRPAEEAGTSGNKRNNRIGKGREATHVPESRDPVHSPSSCVGEEFSPVADTSTFSASCPAFVPGSRDSTAWSPLLDPMLYGHFNESLLPAYGTDAGYMSWGNTTAMPNVRESTAGVKPTGGGTGGRGGRGGRVGIGAKSPQQQEKAQTGVNPKGGALADAKRSGQIARRIKGGRGDGELPAGARNDGSTSADRRCLAGLSQAAVTGCTTTPTATASRNYTSSQIVNICKKLEAEHPNGLETPQDVRDLRDVGCALARDFPLQGAACWATTTARDRQRPAPITSNDAYSAQAAEKTGCLIGPRRGGCPKGGRGEAVMGKSVSAVSS